MNAQQKECPPIRRTLKIKIGLSSKGAPLFSALTDQKTKSALTGGFSGVPGGSAHFTRLSRRVLLSLFGGEACFAHLSAAPLLWKIRLHRRIFWRSRRECSLRAPVPPGLIIAFRRRGLLCSPVPPGLIMENPPSQADFLAFPAGVEPTAFRLGGERSILLSYGNVFDAVSF